MHITVWAKQFALKLCSLMSRHTSCLANSSFQLNSNQHFSILSVFVIFFKDREQQKGTELDKDQLFHTEIFPSLPMITFDLIHRYTW